MEFVRWKVLFGFTVSVSILVQLCPTAPPPVILGVGNTDVSCYTCDNEPDNDRCNGAHLGENGTLTKCETERSNCFNTIKMNAGGDGYSLWKGCMDFDECYDEYYKMVGDPIKGANCVRYTFFGDDPPPGGEECFSCCFAFEGESQTGCNSIPGAPFMPLPDPNNWDPATDKWYGHGADEFTSPAPPGGAEMTARPLAAVTALTLFFLSSMLA
ncbi:63 kDa sperm flagellar membrane protein-like [Asterias rubens]|uniref:63 kDa sperm flagellar membrane protein-like n=1 Tax=Asterias rubens TaxID=7604 RepID=UPI001455B84D|nr:63 kDa sperm flagellar membrane protein-like [Asterias rubens]